MSPKVRLPRLGESFKETSGPTISIRSSESRFDHARMWRNPPQPIALYGAEAEKIHRGVSGVFTDASRMAFALREAEEMDSQEICKILDVSCTNLGVLL